MYIGFKNVALITMISAATAFAAGEIQLVDASSRVNSYRRPSIQTLTADILVKNLGTGIKVGMHYRTGAGTWADAWGSYLYTMGDGRERWQVSFSPCYSYYDPDCSDIDPDFAVRMDVNGQAYWDNNGGANYHLNRQSASPIPASTAARPGNSASPRPRPSRWNISSSTR